MGCQVLHLYALSATTWTRRKIPWAPSPSVYAPYLKNTCVVVNLWADCRKSKQLLELCTTFTVMGRIVGPKPEATMGSMRRIGDCICLVAAEFTMRYPSNVMDVCWPLSPRKTQNPPILCLRRKSHRSPKMDLDSNGAFWFNPFLTCPLGS